MTERANDDGTPHQTLVLALEPSLLDHPTPTLPPEILFKVFDLVHSLDRKNRYANLKSFALVSQTWKAAAYTQLYASVVLSGKRQVQAFLRYGPQATVRSLSIRNGRGVKRQDIASRAEEVDVIIRCTGPDLRALQSDYYPNWIDLIGHDLRAIEEDESDGQVGWYWVLKSMLKERREWKARTQESAMRCLADL
jgi:hypothetical protein